MITAITLEHDCPGCRTGSVLVLRRDGSATLTLTGHARQGTVDQVALGIVRADDFDALARQAALQGFFALAESYDDPDLRDGAWSALRVERGGRSRQIFWRADAGPAALQAFEAAIDAVKGRIQFRAAP